MRRHDLLDRLRSGERWDFVVVGGGATGLGTAVDAASRGYRTVLIESGDFARATSSRSTKLIHGGVRYLARGELGLVREALFERGLLYANAPHLVHETPFLVPAFSRFERLYYGAGLKLYDLLAGRRAGGGSRIVGRDEAARLLPTLDRSNLRGGVVYHDGQFDDARTAIALALTAEDQGATLANYVEATGFPTSGGRIEAVEARDVETGETFRLNARSVVNATGVFVDELRRLDDPRAPEMVRPSRGVHVVLDRSFLPGDAALMIPKTDDGRVLFAIPWSGKVLLGTTDTPVERAEFEPMPSEAEIDYLLAHAGRYLTTKPTRGDARSLFAGLRPLLGRTRAGTTAKLSREHAVSTSPTGLVTICGGKWTTYRRMGEDAVERAVAWAGLPRRPCVTDSLPLHGRLEGARLDFAGRYGSDADAVAAIAVGRPDLAEPIHPALPYRMAEVVWSVREEWARTVEDVLSRRTRALMLDARAAAESAGRVASLLAAELGHGEDWRRAQVEAFRSLAERWM